MSAISFVVPLLAILTQSPLRVEGRVIDDATAPLEYALVEVTSPVTGRTIATRTNARGEYVLRGLEPADHINVTIRRIGFRPVHITLAATGCDETLTGNVQMLPVDLVVTR